MESYKVTVELRDRVANTIMGTLFPEFKEFATYKGVPVFMKEIRDEHDGVQRQYVVDRSYGLNLKNDFIITDSLETAIRAANDTADTKDARIAAALAATPADPEMADDGQMLDADDKAPVLVSIEDFLAAKNNRDQT